jgi:hypothetical protein
MKIILSCCILSTHTYKPGRLDVKNTILCASHQNTPVKWKSLAFIVHVSSHTVHLNDNMCFIILQYFGKGVLDTDNEKQLIYYDIEIAAIQIDMKEHQLHILIVYD